MLRRVKKSTHRQAIGSTRRNQLPGEGAHASGLFHQRLSRSRPATRGSADRESKWRPPRQPLANRKVATTLCPRLRSPVGLSRARSAMPRSQVPPPGSTTAIVLAWTASGCANCVSTQVSTSGGRRMVRSWSSRYPADPQLCSARRLRRGGDAMQTSLRSSLVPTTRTGQTTGTVLTRTSMIHGRGKARHPRYQRVGR